MNRADDGTELYRRVIRPEYYKDEDRRALMETVWSSTPWMVDVYTGSTGGERDMSIRRWCWEQFGDEASPLGGRSGSWQRGSATIYGWTWYGFDTRARMDAFLQRWGSRAA